MSGVLLMHPSSMGHDTGTHPEQAARIAAIEHALREAHFCGYKQVASPPAPVAALRAVHPGRYVDAIREIAEAGGGRIDADTVVSEGSYEAAVHAAGGALELARQLVAGEAPTGFSIHRPPGHHAEPARPMGFCLFNNVAVAARHAIDELGVGKVMIADFDVHHGNGTNAVFHEDPAVLFCSVHQSPLYPGTGPLGDVGGGAGTGTCINLPVPPESGDAHFRGMIEGVMVPLMAEFSPELVLVSAGFDAAAQDPLAQCEVTDAGFAAMTAALRAAALACGAPIGAVLEGGYSLAALPRGVVAALRALSGETEPSPPVDPPDVVVQARSALARIWPVLGED